MPLKVTEDSFLSVSSKFVLKGLLPKEHIRDLKVRGIPGDGSFFSGNSHAATVWEQENKIWISWAERNLHNSIEFLLSQEV